MSNVWHQKQSWIKDILSKSGTEITEIKEEVDTGGKDLRKMVYYTALPLMMQSQPDPSSPLGHIKQEDPSIRISTNTAGLVGSVSAYQSPTPSSIDRHQIIYDQSNQSRHATIEMPPLTSTSAMAQPRPSTAKRQRGQVANKAPKPQFKCEQCNMMFGSKSAHTSHMKSHAKMALKAQQSSGAQMPHMNGEPSNSSASSCSTVASPLSADPYQCDVCHKTFAVPARLVRHYRTHTGERPFECEFCHKMFSVKENLQVHRRIHTKERPYKCDVCGRAFEHSGKLHRHMRIHTGERPHKCSVCGKTFIQSGQLVIHMRTHTGEKPYKCPVEGCGKGFTCSKQLKVHSRTHTGEKPYHCDICFRDFGYNHVLKLHRVQHYGSKCYKCTICDETFKNKKEMEAHIKGHANELPDEEEGMDGASVSSYTTIIEEPVLPIRRVSETDTSSTTSSISVSMSTLTTNKLPETPRETSSSDAMSDADDVAAYYQMYPRFDSNNYGTCNTNGGGVNPALLAAVSLAASAAAEQEAAELAGRMSSPVRRSESPPQIEHHQVQQMHSPLPSTMQSLSSHQYHMQQPSVPHSSSPLSYSHYEPLAMMRQGFYVPVPKVEEFRSSISASSEIVKRVEAALAGAGETLLTPPRSSPESPDRSSSPESESMMMANRANLSLPLRKRKLYHLPDEPTAQQQEQQQQQAAAAMLHLKSSSSAAEDVQMRMSSVIQFAKAT